MAFQESSGEGITGINITPLVDVCLVLVIIFMVTAPLLLQPTLSVELPKATTAEGKERQNVTITITKDGQWALNQESMPFEGVKAGLRDAIASSPDRYVIIRADKEALNGLALQALKIAKDAGAKAIAIATEQKKRAPL